MKKIEPKPANKYFISNEELYSFMSEMIKNEFHDDVKIIDYTPVCHDEVNGIYLHPK